MLEVTGLNCNRNSKALFANLNFSVLSGNLLQIISANGTGKSSLLKILSCILPVTNEQISGQIFWHGKSIFEPNSDYLQQILYLGHKQGIQHSLSPLENLKFLLAINGIKINGVEINRKIIKALEFFKLKKAATLRCSELSAGQCQRVALSRLLLQPAKIWLLDEPCAFIDSYGWQKVSELISEKINNNGLVILVTHKKLEIKSQVLDLVDLAA